MRQGDLFPEGDGNAVFGLPDAELYLARRFLTVAEADRLFTELQSATPWQQEHIVMYGRSIAAPRLTAWYGDRGASYVYSGVRHDPLPWTASLDDLRRRIAERVGARFNSVLLNLYRDGQDSVAWHSDDEPELGPQPVIASLSLGAVRVFQLKHRLRADLDRVDIELPHGSLLVMGGACQSHWQHRVPKRRGRTMPGPRINLTFRLVTAAGRDPDQVG